MLSLQIRYEYITGTTDIYETTPTQCPNKALPHGELRVRGVRQGDLEVRQGSKFHPFFSLAAGGGRIRHVVSFETGTAKNCGPNHDERCVDTIGAGTGVARAGRRPMYDMTESLSIVLQANSVLAFPDFSVHLDGNVGVAFDF